MLLGVLQAVGREHPQPGSFAIDDSTPQLRYERELTVGSVGTLWLGRLAIGAEAGRSVLLRRIPRELFSTKDLETIKKIAEAYSKVRHPSLVKLLGIVEQDGDVVSVSEHLDGVRLSDLVRNAIDKDVPLPATVAVRIVLDAARATTKSHRLAADQGLFPTERLFVTEGIFIAAFGGTLLTELGLLAAIGRCSQPRSFPDLLAQLAPEEINRGPTGQGSCEVFSCGVLLWEMLANRYLFSRDSASITLSELQHRPIQSLGKIERCGMPVPEGLAEVVRLATSRDPTERYATLEAFVAALEQLPAHFVATEHDVASALRQQASDLLKAFHVDPSESSLMLAFSEAPASRLSTRPPPDNGYNWEPPTFAQSRLVTSARALARPSPNAGSVEPSAGAVVEPTRQLVKPLDPLPAAVAVTSANPEPLAPRRMPRAVVWGVLALAVVLGSLGTWRLVRSRQQPRLLHDVVTATPGARPASQDRASPQAPVVPEEPTTSQHDSNGGADIDVASNASRLDSPPKRSTAAPGIASAPTVSTPAPSSRNAGAAFRPHNIAPYRPKGI